METNISHPKIKQKCGSADCRALIHYLSNTLEMNILFCSGATKILRCSIRLLPFIKTLKHLCNNELDAMHAMRCSFEMLWKQQLLERTKILPYVYFSCRLEVLHSFTLKFCYWSPLAFCHFYPISAQATSWIIYKGLYVSVLGIDVCLSVCFGTWRISTVSLHRIKPPELTAPLTAWINIVKGAV